MLRTWPKVLSAGFAALVAAHVMIANDLGSEDRFLVVVAAALVLLLVGSIIVGARTRGAAGWVACGAFVVALATLAVAVLGGNRAQEIAGSINTLATAGGVAALCAVRGGDWGAAAALAALGQLIVLPWSAITEIPFEHLSEMLARHHGVLGVVLQLAVGYAACSAVSAKRE